MNVLLYLPDAQKLFDLQIHCSLYDGYNVSTKKIPEPYDKDVYNSARSTSLSNICFFTVNISIN